MLMVNSHHNILTSEVSSSMLKSYKILTVTHKRTNLKEIGQFVVSNGEDDSVETQLIQIKTKFGIEELMYLSTCNRVMYLFYTDQDIDQKWVRDFATAVNPDLDVTDLYLNEHLLLKEGKNAISHLLEVAASVDSMVIGEREILRQLREAYDQSYKWGFTGDNIRLLIKTMVESAKEVYAQTRIGEKPISVVSLAVQELLKTKISREAKILLIGAGKTNSLVSKFLKKHQFKHVTVFNRTLDRAKQLARMLSGQAHRLSDLQNFKNGFDAIIVCTGATQAVINIDLYNRLLNGDTAHKIVVDLSIPNNVSREVVDQFDMTYIEIEGLRSISEQNKAFRYREITLVKKLLKQRLIGFETLFQQRKIARAMRHVPTEIKAVKERAINEVFKKQLDELDEDALSLVHEMLNYMERRCIGIPMKAAQDSVL